MLCIEVDVTPLQKVERARNEEVIQRKDALLQQLQQQVWEKTVESKGKDIKIQHLQEELEHELVRNDHCWVHYQG